MEIINRVKHSGVYKEWHTDEYVVNYFFMGETETVDFYSKKTKKITSFVIGEKIERKEDKIFQKKGEDLKELEVEKVKIEREEALKITKEIAEKTLRGENMTKTIAILQQQTTPLWNITYITANFNIMNVKIDAVTGEKLEEGVHSLLNLMKK